MPSSTASTKTGETEPSNFLHKEVDDTRDAVVNFRPYYYGNIQVNTHGSYANYNALQLSWQKQTGRATFMFNYTWSKTMGIWDGQTDNGTGANGALVDPFNIKNNYGVLGYDRTHIFNAAYVIQLPDPIKGDSLGEKIGKGFVNGWQVSGIVQRQSGVPIQPSTSGTLNAQWPGGWGTANLLGSNVGTLVPVLICDPRKGLSSGQYSTRIASPRPPSKARMGMSFGRTSGGPLTSTATWAYTRTSRSPSGTASSSARKLSTS